MKIQTEDLVLVVDDVLENRVLAVAFLEKLGWMVLEASSGQAAVDVLKRVRPTHLLLDIKMPGFDGIAVARYVREFLGDHQMKIIGYTAHALKDEVERIFASGFDAVLIKPITYADISEQFGPANVRVL